MSGTVEIKMVVLSGCANFTHVDNSANQDGGLKEFWRIKKFHSDENQSEGFSISAFLFVSVMDDGRVITGTRNYTTQRLPCSKSRIKSRLLIKKKYFILNEDRMKER